MSDLLEREMRRVEGLREAIRDLFRASPTANNGLGRYPAEARLQKLAENPSLLDKEQGHRSGGA